VRVSGLPVGAVRLGVAIEQEPGRLSLELEASGGLLALELRPQPPLGARDLIVTVDGVRAPAGPTGRVEVALDGRPRRVDVRWTGGLDVEPPATRLQPGQADHGVRVLGFAAVGDGWRLALEGPSGESATVRLHGESPLAAEGATLKSRGLVTEATVVFPASDRPFTRAEVALTTSRPRASFPRNVRPSKDLKAATSTR
jgi:hypothetical protein